MILEPLMRGKSARSMLAAASRYPLMLQDASKTLS